MVIDIIAPPQKSSRMSFENLGYYISDCFSPINSIVQRKIVVGYMPLRMI